MPRPLRGGGGPLLALTATGAMFGGVAAYLYVKERRRVRDLESECLALPRDRNYQSSYLQLVQFRGCVLNKDTVTSGTMKKVEELEVRPTDVFVASFPKSGTTWLQEVVYRLYMLEASKNDRGELTQLVERSKDPMDSRFPYLEFPYPGLEDINCREGVRLIKTHLPVHLLPSEVWKGKIIYIYRNPKDVAV